MIQLSENRTGMLANIRDKVKHLGQLLAGHKACGAVGSLIGIDQIALPVVFAALTVAHSHDHEDQQRQRTDAEAEPIQPIRKVEGCRKAGKESGVRECGRRPKHGAGLLPCTVIGKKLREVAAPVEQRQRSDWNNEKLNQLLFRNRARSFQTVENQCFAASHTARRSPARLLLGNRSKSMSPSFRAAPARYRNAGCEENHRCIQMPVNVRTFCQCLELHLDRGNFQIGNEGVNDAALLSRAAQQEVDGNHLYNLDIAVISCINDAVLNLLDRDIVRQGIERLNGFLLLQEGLELRHAALLQINRKSAAAFGERRIFCFAVAFPLLRPAGQQRFSIFAALRPIA